MVYDETESFTSHASSMVSRASNNISMIQSLLWEIKVRYMDDPNRDTVEKTNEFISMAREQLQKAISDLDSLGEEMKRYNAVTANPV